MHKQHIERASGSMISFKRPDGSDVNGYLASPATLPGAPAIVVIQEWWGINDQIKGVADRLAECGYRVLVPDLYRGVLSVDEEEAHHMMDSLDFSDAVAQDIKGAALYLQADSEKVGVTGYCMGGALTLLALSSIPEFVCGVVWYGFPPLEYVDATKIKAALIGHWASQDIFFNIETVNELESKLHESDVDATFYTYLAHHAFANECAQGDGRISGTQYDATWSEMAWDRTLTFFGRQLWVG